MMRALSAAVLSVVAALVAAPSAACPPASATLLFHSCWGPSEASLVLLPDDAGALDDLPEGHVLVVTGAYTGKDERAPGKPAPVGLLLRDGELVGRHLARMDGILLMDSRLGRLELHPRSAVPLGGTTYDLAPLDQREEFFRQASARGLSVIQSHLLVVGGRVDTRPLDDAPRSVRRILFTDADGYGVWQSPTALTLDDAARSLAAEFAPAKALNLDMGSFDFCLARRPDGTERRCGVIGRAEAVAKLSNLLVFVTR